MHARSGESLSFFPLLSLLKMQSQGINVPAAQQLRFAKAKPTVPKPAPRKPVEGLLKDPNMRMARRPWTPSFGVAVRLIILVRFLAGMYSSISDCDEGESVGERLEGRRNAEPPFCASVQLLGAAPLSRQGEGIPDLGVLARLRDSVLLLPRVQLSSGLGLPTLPRQGELELGVGQNHS